MDLSVEWKPVDQISALELLAVGLIHCNTISFPVEYLYFIHHANVTSTEATFSCDNYGGLHSIIHSNSFIVVSVLPASSYDIKLCFHTIPRKFQT